jgi:hypothetical protein
VRFFFPLFFGTHRQPQVCPLGRSDGEKGLERGWGGSALQCPHDQGSGLPFSPQGTVQSQAALETLSPNLGPFTAPPPAAPHTKPKALPVSS